jgi:hypothetical protein
MPKVVGEALEANGIPHFRIAPTIPDVSQQGLASQKLSIMHDVPQKGLRQYAAALFCTEGKFTKRSWPRK